MLAWHESRFTGPFTLLVRVPPRPHDPSLSMAAGEMPPWIRGDPELGCSGGGWTAEEADGACLGEAVERMQARALPGDASVRAAFKTWPLDEPAVDPRHWALYHAAQYESAGFPFATLRVDSDCNWVCCREAATGAPWWVPEEMVYLVPRPGETQRYAPGLSTGLSCGRLGEPILLRGAQEVIERDGLVGGWWGKYPVEEWPVDSVRDLVGVGAWERLDRPNLRYRCYHIRSPYSNHVTLVSLSGEDDEGWVYSVGSACRESRSASWRKSLLEAVQGRHCVRRLLARWHQSGRRPLEVPTTFFEHALYYAVHPERLSQTVLERGGKRIYDHSHNQTEGLAELRARLGSRHPILFRNLTPPGLTAQLPEWLVLRVVIPGLQPLHGDHRLPFLGGPLWGSKPCTDWAAVPPHPFA